MWNQFKVKTRDTRTTPTSFWCLYCQLWTDFTHYSGVSILDFNHVNVCWVRSRNFGMLDHKHPKTELRTLHFLEIGKIKMIKPLIKKALLINEWLNLIARQPQLVAYIGLSFCDVFLHAKTIQPLTYFIPLFSFYTPWKHQKTPGFLMFLGGIKSDQWHEKG